MTNDNNGGKALESAANARVLRIEPTRGWAALNLRDLWEYRDLFLILALRDVKLRYKQTALGVIWVVLQPLITALIFTVVFGNLANLPSDGMPYLLFSFAGMLPWNLFSQSLQRGGNSLVGSSALISKVYFPRMIIPMASTIAVLVDFAVALVVMAGLLVYYQVPIGWNLLLVPPLMIATVVAASGVSLWVSALSVQYRDFIYALPFLLQAWMYASPVAYSTSLIPERWRALYALNPLVGLIDGFRWSLLGHGSVAVSALALAFATSALLFVSGATFFRRMERSFADTI